MYVGGGLAAVDDEAQRDEAVASACVDREAVERCGVGERGIYCTLVVLVAGGVLDDVSGAGVA